ncbi:AAA family ATPase [Sorangium sp. So ce429]
MTVPLEALAGLDEGPLAWAELNQRWLKRELARLRARIDRQVLGEAQQDRTEPVPGGETIREIALKAEFVSGLNRCAALFGLSEFERELLLLTAGVELDAELRRTVLRAQGGESVGARAYQPTFSLAFRLLERPHWDALSPDAPLRRWRLIEVEGRSPTHEPLYIDERVFHFVAGVDALDSRLVGLVRVETCAGSAVSATPAQDIARTHVQRRPRSARAPRPASWRRRGAARRGARRPRHAGSAGVVAARPRPADGVSPEALAAALRPALQQFQLSRAALRRVLEQVQADALAGDVRPLAARIWAACRHASRGGLEELGQRLDAHLGFDDVVLPAAQLQMLRDIAEHVNHRHTVYGEWGMGGKTGRGKGLCVLFAGESGTGKTLAAEAIAREARLDLYRIDLAAMVSKYIGETEKNLKRVFDAAEASGAVLLFDEADGARAHEAVGREHPHHRGQRCVHRRGGRRAHLHGSPAPGGPPRGRQARARERRCVVMMQLEDGLSNAGLEEWTEPDDPVGLRAWASEPEPPAKAIARYRAIHKQLGSTEHAIFLATNASGVPDIFWRRS